MKNSLKILCTTIYINKDESKDLDSDSQTNNDDTRTQFLMDDTYHDDADDDNYTKWSDDNYTKWSNDDYT